MSVNFADIINATHTWIYTPQWVQINREYAWNILVESPDSEWNYIPFICCANDLWKPCGQITIIKKPKIIN